ncbi:MAG TPA: hypothetical protein VJJ46_06170 [Anaerolineales bacterium]|nr:hypothetical protein [Anaerolineales bacterium]
MDRRARRSVRLPQHDYCAPGAYFVTICTYGRAPLLGEVMAGCVRLSEIGRISDGCWRAIPAHFPYVELYSFVVMPNHIHGILVFNDTGRGVQHLPWRAVPGLNAPASSGNCLAGVGMRDRDSDGDGNR